MPRITIWLEDVSHT